MLVLIAKSKSSDWGTYDALRTMEEIVPWGRSRLEMDMSTQEEATASAGSADQTRWLHNARLPIGY